MSRRLFLIIVITAAILVIGAVAVIFIVNRSPALQNSVLQIANVNKTLTSQNNTNAQPANTNSVADDQNIAREFVARNFTESFGSGASQDNFANLAKAKPFVTESFGAFLDRSQAQQRQATISGPYHAFLTKVLVITTTKVAATTASITVGTQRQETLEAETKTYYQDLLIDLIKVGDDWKVNAAAWNPST